MRGLTSTAVGTALLIAGLTGDVAAQRKAARGGADVPSALDRQIAGAHIRALKTGDELAQSDALQQLRMMGTKAGPEAIAGVTEFIRTDKRPYEGTFQRCSGFRALVWMGPEAMPVLLDIMKTEPSANFRGCYVSRLVDVAKALSIDSYVETEGFGPHKPYPHAATIRTAVIAMTLEAIAKPEVEGQLSSRESGIEVLSNLWPPAIPEIVGLMKSPESGIRAVAAGFFNYRFPFQDSRAVAEAKKAIPALTPLLEDPEPVVQRAAAESLQKLSRR